MKCKNIKKKLYFYHYDILNFFWKKIVERHLKKCPECQKEYNLIKHKIKFLNVQKKQRNVEEYLDNRILKQASQIFKQRSTQKLKSYKPLVFKLGFAFVFIFIISIVFYYEYNIRNRIGTVYITNEVMINNKVVTGHKTLYTRADLIIKKDSQAEIKNNDIYNINLYANTGFLILRKKRTVTSIMMNYGTAYFNVEKNKSDMEIETINSIIKITGTEFKLFVNKNKTRTIIEVHEGSIAACNKFYPSEVKTAEAGDKIEIKNKDIPVITKSKIPLSIDKEPEIKPFIKKIKEKIYLKNGNVVIGYIIKQNSSEIIIKTKTGKIKLNNKDIKKIEYVK